MKRALLSELPGSLVWGNNNFVKNVISWSKERKKLELVDDQVSSPTYSKDLAEYSWKLINSGKFGLYHLSNDGCS